MCAAGNEIIFNRNPVPTREDEETGSLARVCVHACVRVLARAEGETSRSRRTPEETGPPFEAKFNDAIKIWTSLGRAAGLYIFFPRYDDRVRGLFQNCCDEYVRKTDESLASRDIA